LLEAKQNAEVRLERVAALQEVTSQLAEALRPRDIIRVLFDAGLKVLGASGGAAALLTKTGDEFEMVDFCNVSEENVTKWQRFPNKAGIPMADVVPSGKPIFFKDVNEAAKVYPELAAAAKSKQQAWANVPLVSKGRPLGAVSIGFTQAKVLSAEEQSFLVTSASQCAQALERAELYEEVKRREARLTLALQNSGVILAGVDTDLRYLWIHNPHPDFKDVAAIGKRADELLPSL
jgi:GAF domain-containing protein